VIQLIQLAQPSEDHGWLRATNLFIDGTTIFMRCILPSKYIPGSSEGQTTIIAIHLTGVFKQPSFDSHQSSLLPDSISYLYLEAEYMR
jgi:hypothetical protein